MTTATRLRTWLTATVALAAGAGGLAAVGTPSAGAVEGDLTTDLVGWWKLDETSGTVAADSSGNGRDAAVVGAATWNGGDGFTFGGGAASGGNAIKLPDNLVTGLTDVTVDFDVWVDPTLTSGNWFMFNLGNPATYPDGTGYLFTTNDSNNRLRGTIAENGFPTEQSAARAGRVPTGQWRHVTLSIDGGTPAAPGALRLYEDGVLAAENTALTTNPSLLGTPDGTTTHNYLGRSAYAGDLSFKGRLRDFRVYSRALTGAEAAESAADTSTAAADSDTAALTLGDTSAVVADLALPATGPSGSTITWATSDPGVVGASGAVTRPAFGQPDGTATLTATVTRGAVSRTRTFEVTVPAEELDDTGKVQEAVAAVALVHPDDVRGNLTLPAAGLHQTTLTWSSSVPGVVSASGAVTRPAYGEQPVDVTLTVTATRGAASASRSIVLRVQPLPAPADYEGYAFAYFAGESTDEGESIYFAASKGNDPLEYDELNDGDPVLESAYGTTGLRDPFIIRSPEGDRFFLLATDLKAYPEVDFGEAQETGSKYVEIWESTDLVTWSEQRHVKVSSDFAGNTWAPEAFYDEEAGEYVVFWASALYPTTETTGRDINTQYQRMMYATTRDFVTFSEPQVWVDVRRGAGRGIIDATVVRDGDMFYRILKDEASMTPRQERSTELRATVTGSLPTTTTTPGWQLVKERVGVGQPNPWGGTFTNGEGPTMFPDNEVPGRWYLFIDQPSYHGGQGYLAFRTDDLASGSWTSVPDADLPSSPRHGTVIPVTQAELDRMREAYQPELLVRTVQDVEVRTREGVAPVLPATVAATFGDGSTGQVEVDWDDVDPAAYAEPGTFTVEGTVVRGSADRPVATVVVTDALDPEVTVSQTPDGEAGWWVTDPATVRVTATDDTGVASVQTALDGGDWTTTEGAAATAPVTGDGRHTLAVRALDTTGNTSAAEEVEVKIDTTAPVSRATVAADRQVTVRAADTTSGVARVETRLTGAEAWTPYDGPVQVGDAGGMLEYRAVDTAGNTEPTHRVVVPGTGEEVATSTVVAVADPDRVRYGAPVAVAVRVKGGASVPTGVVRVLSGGTQLAAGRLGRDGRVRLVVDSADLGRTGAHTLVVRYDGDATHAADEDRVDLRVTRAASTTRLTVSRPDRRGAGAVATVRVGTDPAGQLPDRVRVTLARGGSTGASRWLDLTDRGRARWELPRLGSGRWTVTATTPRTDTLAGSSDSARFPAR
ncbi:immunoglobulin-like domain-containing protein [Nocardioides dongkuii]|uniref:immunoglobulin-like domain-containing protein n=1 Tax=Nocardioides dongkuii TaxID=2760089 RepID=UPI00187893B9|nr:immunoglobulin-like domain-containing protein [Nocardioides dongkuii]